MALLNFLKSRFLLSLNKQQISKLDKTRVNKVLALKYDKIGDMVVATPFFREIKKSIPNCQLTVLCSKSNYPIIVNNPFIDEVHIYQNQWNRLFPVLLKLRKKKFDLCFEFEAGVVTKAILVTKIIKPLFVASVFKQHGRYGLRAEQIKIYDFYTENQISSHRSLNILDTLKFLDISSQNNKYELYIESSSMRKALNFLNKYSTYSKKVGINFEGITYGGSIDSIKIKEIISGISEEYSNAIFFILAPPWDKKKVNVLIESLGIQNLIPTYLNISDVIAFVDLLDLVISVDTSIVHISSALNTPLVAIYANDLVNYGQWSPNSENFETVFSKNKRSFNNFSTKEVINSSIKLLDL